MTSDGKDYFLAWTEPNQSLWWTTSPATRNQETFAFAKPTQFPNAASSEGPALASFGGDIWMAWKGEATDTRIFLATIDGSTSAPSPIFGVGTSSSPALTASRSELYLAFKGESDGKIYFAKSSDGKTWSTATAVADVLTSDAPAIAAYENTVYLGFKGASDDNLYLATYTETDGWTSAVQLPTGNYLSSNGPALGVGDTGQLHIAWKDATSTDIRSVSIPPGTVIDSKTSWPTVEHAGIIETSARPAIASQPSANTYVLLAFKGNSQNVYVGSLDGLFSIQPYTFTFDNFQILNTRSGNILSTSTDTDYASFSLTVGTNGTPQILTQYMGNLSNGTYTPTNLHFDSVNIADSEIVILTYNIVNSSAGESSATAYLQQAAGKLASTAASKAATLAGDALGAAIGAALGTPTIPLVGSALGALAGFLVANVWSIAFPNCDGPVAAGIHAYTGADLRAFGYSQSWTENNPGINSPDGCGSNSNYNVTYSISRG